MRLFDIFLITLILTSSCTPSGMQTPTQHSTASIPPTSTALTELTPTDTLMPTPVGTVNLIPFGTVNIDTSDIKFNLNGDGSNVDSISFWEAPNPTESLMFVTSKGNSSFEVYQYPFQTQLRTLSCGEASNGVWVDQDRDVLYITERYSSNVCAYNLPGLDNNSSLSFTTAATGGDSEPNLTMLNIPDDQRRIYVSYNDHVYYHDAETGEALGAFEPDKGLETMYGDDYYQVIYMPDENSRSGVYIYDGDGNPAGAKFGDHSIFESDAEGIWVYKCPGSDALDSGEGLIVVADQKHNVTDFEVFNRRTKEHLGKINIDGVNNTDGIAITQQSFPAYPLGLLAVIDDDTSTVGVGWDTILAETGLTCGG
jgi:hypothetical protein